MQGSVNRSVVVVSGLLTLLLLCGATLALALHNGWLRTSAGAPAADTLQALAQAAAEPGVPDPAAVRLSVVSNAQTPAAGPDDVAVYRTKLEEAYRALDDAYLQIQSLQTANAPLADGDGTAARGRRHHDDDEGHHEGEGRRRRSEHR